MKGKSHSVSVMNNQYEVNDPLYHLFDAVNAISVPGYYFSKPVPLNELFKYSNAAS